MAVEKRAPSKRAGREKVAETPESLAAYAEKRRFDETPEPGPGGSDAGADEALSFCIQRHHARQLHYDLRLEVGGTLKSWAVPKGPTLDPAEKRLAMMTEDHPLLYRDFEGVIPKGNYGAGSMMLWDRGTYEVLQDVDAEAQLARGDFKFRLHGEKVRGEFAIVRTKRGKGNEWLLLKKKDDAAEAGWDAEEHDRSVLTGRTQQEIAEGLPGKTSPAKSRTKRKKAGPETSSTIPNDARLAGMPKAVAPMLAQIGKGDPPQSDDQWLYEVKWDGVRALCTIRDGELQMESRTGNRMERQYPELSTLPHHLKGVRAAILDGEIAALDERGAPSFELIQRRIHLSDASAIATLSRNEPVVLYLFDLLYLQPEGSEKGYDLRGVAVEERKRLLREILTPSDAIRFSEHFEGGGRELMDAVRAQGIEGVVGKRRGSFYESRRTGDWVKYKVTASDSFALCGFTEGERDLFGALVLGCYDAGKLVWAGNVGTGFDRKTMAMIHERLAPLAVKKCPLEPDKNLPKKGVTWTRPELVCEVRYTNWTSDGRLRAPVYVGLRPDIDPEECVKPGSEDAAPVREPLLSADEAEAERHVDGHRLKFTNLGKVFYPDEGYTKRDLLNYYDAVADLIVPHLKDRPLSLKRYPNGIAADFFFQKEVAASFPKWLRTGMADGKRHVIGEDRATLLFLVNLGCIDHNPWMSRLTDEPGSLEHPDYLLIDLDPQECAYSKIVEAALLVRAKLDLAELESYPKTTGGDGMHLFVPLEPEYSYEQVRGFAELLSTLVAAERPDLFTTPRAVSKRQKDRVYFDWAQIAQGKTISAPYVVRAYAGAPVATPLRWNEVTPRLDPAQFHIGNAMARFDRVGDLFRGVLEKPQSLAAGLERLSARLE